MASIYRATDTPFNVPLNVPNGAAEAIYRATFIVPNTFSGRGTITSQRPGLLLVSAWHDKSMQPHTPLKGVWGGAAAPKVAR
jgi:hypothetical protein